MRAWTYDRYGGPDVLELAAVPEPRPGPGDLLVRVEVAALNAADRHMMSGEPLLIRAVAGLGARPRRRRIVGSDIAGVVTAVGAEVEGFSVGDRIHAEIDDGGAAPYAVVPARAAARVPEGMATHDAAAIGMAAITALHAVREGGRVGPGDRVLVNGASGGVGTFAVQIARALGAEVIAVASSRNADLMRSLGAEPIAYDQDDFTRGVRGLDALIDVVGNHSVAALRPCVTRGGAVVLVGGGGGRVLGPLGGVLAAVLTSPFVPQRLHPVLDSRPSGTDLRFVDELAERGLVRPVIDRVVPFEDVPGAMAHLMTRRARGKILIQVTGNGTRRD